MTTVVRGVRTVLGSTAVVGLAAGAAATLVKMKAEGLLQPWAEHRFPPRAGEKTLRGADPSGHPDDMPPSVLVDEVAGRLTGQPADDDARGSASAALHWGMGVGSALAYVVLARRFPAVRAGRGALAGVLLYAGTHGSTLPAAGLQASLGALPHAALVWEPGSHVAYALAADAVLELGDRIRP